MELPIQAQHPETRAVVQRRVLKDTLPFQPNHFHIDLHRIDRLVLFEEAQLLGTPTRLGLGEIRHFDGAEGPMNRRRVKGDAMDA